MTGSLQVGDVVRRVFGIYVDQAPILFPAAAVVFVVEAVAAELILNGAPGLAILVLALDLFASSLFTGLIAPLVDDRHGGRRDTSVRQLLRAVRPVLGELVAVSVVAALGEAVGFILIVPGLFLLTIWAVAAPVVVIERPGGLRALDRSRELVRGNGWAVFGVIILFAVIVLVVGGAIEVGAASAGSTAALVADVAVSVLTLPLLSLASAVLYFQLRNLQQPAV
jgi:hypothetical protein